MLFIVKNFVLGMLFWLALTLPGSAESAERTEYRIVQIKESTVIMIAPDQQWRVCSNFFYAVETPKGKKVYFHIETEIDGKLTTKPIRAPIGQVVYKFGGETGPRLSFGMGDFAVLYVLQISPTDYVAGLPCLEKGGKVVLRD